MQALTKNGDFGAFFLAMARSKERPLLLLDFDGTLAPFQNDRDTAAPYPGVADALNRIRQQGPTRIVVISGRSIEVLKRLLPLDPLPELWGSHGRERLAVDGTYHLEPLTPHMSKGLSRAFSAAEKLGCLRHCEQKPASIALHWRGLTAQERASFEPAMIEHWKAISTEYGLELHGFDGGVELRVLGKDKGSAVCTLLTETAPGTSVAYLGDDKTDEDAFAALAGVGLGVLVRTVLRESLADVWIQPPEELLQFLAGWANASAR